MCVCVCVCVVCIYNLNWSAHNLVKSKTLDKIKSSCKTSIIITVFNVKLIVNIKL